MRGPLFSIKTVRNEGRKKYRVAVVVSRKVCKSAVGRNRMRRRLYATVRELADAIQEPYDIVITVFHDALLETPAGELKKQVRTQLKAAGILAE